MSKARVAVIGGGISGMVAATVVAKSGVEVVLYDMEEDRLGGHAKSVSIDGVDLDLDFIVFNRVTHPNLREFFECIGVEMVESNISFSVSSNKGQGYEWGIQNGLPSLFSQKKNILNPYFWLMIREITCFKNNVQMFLQELKNNPDIEYNETLGHFIKSRGYSELFQKAYLVPMCASIWSNTSERVLNFSAYSVLSYLLNHNLLQIFGHPQWFTARCHSQDYVNKVREQLEIRGCEMRSCCEELCVSTNNGCIITSKDGSQESYDGCIMTIHPSIALKMLGKQATSEEVRVLGAFQYVRSNVFLHRDKSLMPQNPLAWSACNFLGTTDDKVWLTYWLNLIQNIRETELPYLVTINPPHIPQHTLLKWSTFQPLPSIAESKASIELDHIQGKRGIWFSRAHHGYGFHEDGVKDGLAVAYGMLKKRCAILDNPKHIWVPSLVETGARLCVTKFLERHISVGGLILLEEGGTIFSFEGTKKKSLLKTSLKVHNPEFYFKVATQDELGLADAYINGDFTLVDKKEGLQNLFMIFIANKDFEHRFSKARGWWTPLLFTAFIGSAKNFLKHVSRRNTITQAQRNISSHYDMSNEFFALFMGETMMYSCAIFKSKNEDLKEAQMRKISLLIEKARISKEHEILEIGCGWGSFAIEVINRTGCNYTGITLSKEQLKFAEMKVKEVGLQDRARFILCDYRQMTDAYKYDRIIACEMIEAVGHEYMDEFFRRCDLLLAEDGLFVLQFTSIPDQCYDEYRRSSDFIKEYIFPGGCLPSFHRTTSAMAASSRLRVEHVENIGIHYIQTLQCWKESFLEQRSKIMSLGFSAKFIRTWEYYFDYCIAGFKTCTLANYQMVLSRPGNVSTLGDPYKGIPSAY